MFLLFNCPESAKHQFSANNILKYFFSNFSQTRFDISCKLSPICMKCQILFSGLFEPKVISYFAIAAHTRDGACFLLRCVWVGAGGGVSYPCATIKVNFPSNHIFDINKIFRIFRYLHVSAVGSKFTKFDDHIVMRDYLVISVRGSG